ncbi:TPA: hypothetical protein ACW7Y0_000507 [Aeromonas hydrophila]
MTEFVFKRAVRTSSSETYYIFPNNEVHTGPAIASLDIHIDGNVYHGTLVLMENLLENDIDILLDEINDQIISLERTDFILTVYQGKEVGFYSDTVTDHDRQSYSATKGDIEDMRTSLKKVLGRHQHAKAQLSEHAVCSYLESLGYNAKRAGAELDAKKIDIVAYNEIDKIYAQVKVGAISEREMSKVVASVESLPKEDNLTPIVAFFSSKYPANCEFHRSNLEKNHNIKILCISSVAVLEKNPDYKRSLGN